MLFQIVNVLKSFSKTERQIFAGTAVIFLMSLFFWGLQTFYNITLEMPARGGQYIEGIVGQPTTLNPLIVGSNDVDRDLTELLFADLAELAEEIKISEDYKNWTITLKPNLSWSDGKPLTTADVVFTLEAIQNPDTQSSSFASWQGVVAERLSEREVRLSLKNPYVFFGDNLKRLKITPRHIFGNIPPSNLRLSSYNLEPIASGPYKFISYDKRKDGFITKYHLELNENYAGSQPFIEAFDFVFFADEDEAIAAFNQREVSGLGGLDPKKLSELKIGHRTFGISVPRYYAIFLNQSTHPALKEKVVRQALSSLVDHSRIIREVFDNQALIINGPLPSILDGYIPDIKSATSTDIKSVRELLEKSGWKLNEESIREKTIARNKIRLEFNLVVPQVPFLIQTAELIQGQWAQAGIKLNLSVLTLAETNDAIKNRNYSLLIFGNTLRGNPDAFSFWHSSERFYPGLNLSIYSDKTVDALLENIRQDLKEETRKEKLVKFQNIIRQDQPAIFLFSPNYLYASIRNLGNFEPKIIVTPSDRFANVNSWHVKTSRTLR